MKSFYDSDCMGLASNIVKLVGWTAKYTVGPRFTGPRFTGTPIYREHFFPPIFLENFRSLAGWVPRPQIRHGIAYRFVSNRLISGRTCDKMHRLETRFGLGRIYGSNMLYPDIPGTPIYRAKWLPPRIPVNRGPTDYKDKSLYFRLLRFMKIEFDVHLQLIIEIPENDVDA
eukprot:sb/3472173/